MSLYHYLLCNSAGRVESTESVKCASDAAARKRAVKMLPRQGIHVVEIWEGQRRVDRVG
jgi:hypothetical protein